jgi:hypothetical protein
MAALLLLPLGNIGGDKESKIDLCLNEQFLDRWILLGGLKNWPSRSPDLCPLIFCV